jgi:dihydrodipicolinate synthase/N-acetylneuraminate lyase
MSEFHGVLPALITPFTDDGTAIDAEALAANVERLIAAGAGGLVPGGSTGEFTTLTNAERRQLTEVTVAAAAGRVPVVAGTGALSTRETVELSVHAEQAGAAAVMIVPPFYDPLPWRELLAHYAAVADAIDIPIMYCNLPSATGQTLTAEQLRELPITSLKDTGGECHGGHRADPDRRPDAAQRLGHADVRRAGRRRARRCVGRRVDRA